MLGQFSSTQNQHIKVLFVKQISFDEHIKLAITDNNIS